MQTARRTERHSEKRARLAIFAVALAALAAVSLAPRFAAAQSVPRGLLEPGNAAVTGFSGAIPPAQIAPGIDPASLTFIDRDGPSLRIVDLQNMTGAPAVQLVDAPKPFTITAAQIGQVFAVAIDNVTPPNIYVAATSSYGLPVVVAGADGQLSHAKTGGPNTVFMPGLWGNSAPDGGPGSIWRIDGITGAVTLFANVALNGAINSGPALGGLVFDPDANALFVADRETGMIHRFEMDGRETARFDHGVQGREAAGLAPIAFDPSRHLDVTNPQFDSEQPQTWNLAPAPRRVFGLGIRAGRLFYVVADGLQIWSVAITAGGFSDPVLELNVPPAAGPTEISKIVFDDQGRMVLAERPDPTGAYDFHALAREGVGRVLRFAIVDSYPGAPRVWQQIPDEYALGFPLDLRNGNGGVDIGYDYDRIGRIDRGLCGGFLWSTGENLRHSADSSLSAPLDAAGPPNVDGLQGNYIWNIRPKNVPPLKSYFIDYDGRFDDTAARGHMGDLAIWRVCGPVLRSGWMLPGWMTVWQFWSDSPPNKLRPPPPRLTCPPDQLKPGFQCCPKGTSPDAAGQCKPWCPSGSMDPSSQKICGLGFDAATYDPGNLGKLKCLGGAVPNGALGILGCAQHSPVLNPPACQMGWSKQMMPNVGMVCMPSPQQLQCPAGQQFNTVTGKCQILCLSGTAWPSTQCCPAGAAAGGLGQCCPAGSFFDPKTGLCQPLIKIPPGKIPPKFSCAPAQLGKDGTCCKSGSSPNDVGGGCCPSGQAAGPNGICKLIGCPPPGKAVAGKCCSPNDLKPGGVCAQTVCGPGKAPAGASNACCDANHIFVDGDGHQQCCPANVSNGKCQPLGGTPVLPKCAPGSTDPNCCASGYKPAKGGACCLASQMTPSSVCCPAGQAPGGPGNNQCQPGLKTSIPPWQNGDGGSGGNQCCMAGTIPTASGMCCSPDQVTPAGLCCPSGQKPDPRNRLVCAPTTVCGVRETSVNGACCPNSNLYNDSAGRQQCCAQLVDPQTGVCAAVNIQVPPQCAAGYTQMPDRSCCANKFVSADGLTCRAPSQTIVPVAPGVPKQQIAPPVDCSARGPNFIRDSGNPRACIRCPRGLVANDNATNCVRRTPGVAPSGRPAPQVVPRPAPLPPPGQLRRPAPPFARPLPGPPPPRFGPPLGRRGPPGFMFRRRPL
jgi:hypothetical protein